MTIRIFLVVLLLFSITGGLAPSRSCAEELTRTQKEELLDKAQAALLWFRSIGNESDQYRMPRETYQEHLAVVELIQVADMLHSYNNTELSDLAERLLMMFPFYRLTPEESFELYDLIGDDILFELGNISPSELTRLPADANYFRTRQLNGAERVVLYQEPATALELMNVVDVLSVVGRPVFVRHYLRKFLAGTPATTPEESAKIVETLGTQKLMQLAIHPEFAPLSKEAVAKIIDEAKKHWQSPERIAEALKETQWFTDSSDVSTPADVPAPVVIPAQAGIQTEDVNSVTLAPRLRGGDGGRGSDEKNDGVVSPQVRPEARPALHVIWKGDQLSVQQVFEKLGTITDEREADELTAILLALRPDMKEALACALDSMNPRLRYHAARGLAASVTPQESFLLYTSLYLDDWFIEGQNAILSESEREVIRNTLQRRRIAVPSREQAAAILFERATDYSERRRPLRINADGLVSYWMWTAYGDEECTAKYRQFDIENGYRYFASEYYQLSYEILPKTSANYRSYRFACIIANLEEHGKFYEGANAVYPLSDIHDDPNEMEQLLQMCLEKERVSAADAAVYRLGKIGNADLLKSTNGKPRTLVQAVVAKDRGVRFSALEAIMSITFPHETRGLQSPQNAVIPAQAGIQTEDMIAISLDPRLRGGDGKIDSASPKPFAGSSLVAETLVWFSKSEGQSVMLSGHPQMATANQTASLFLGLGYQTDVATTCRELFALAAASPDVEVVFVDARTSQPPVGEFVQHMRQDARTAEIPIAILGGDERDLNPNNSTFRARATRRNEMTQFDRRSPDAPFRTSLSLTYPRLASEESARWVRDDLLEKTRCTHHPLFGEKGLHNWESARASVRTSTARLAQAKQALGWLREIKEAELSGAPKIYHFEDFDSVVLNALHSERRVKEGLDLAAVVKSPVLQSAIYDLAANAIYPMEIRDYAGDAFIKSVQTFGILLRGEQIQRLYDRYNQSEFEPQESQELLGRLLDAVEKKVNAQ